MGSGHIKVKKGTHHLFHMAIARHTAESVGVAETAKSSFNAKGPLHYAFYESVQHRKSISKSFQLVKPLFIRFKAAYIFSH